MGIFIHLEYIHALMKIFYFYQKTQKIEII